MRKEKEILEGFGMKNCKFICMNRGIEWESIDYHLSVESMLELTLKSVA